MSVHTRQYRTAAVAAAATTALLFAAAPTSARPAPDRERHTVPAVTCPTRADIAKEMRGYGISAQGAKNIAVFAYRDCIHGT